MKGKRFSFLPFQRSLSSSSSSSDDTVNTLPFTEDSNDSSSSSSQSSVSTYCNSVDNGESSPILIRRDQHSPPPPPNNTASSSYKSQYADRVDSQQCRYHRPDYSPPRFFLGGSEQGSAGSSYVEFSPMSGLERDTDLDGYGVDDNQEEGTMSGDDDIDSEGFNSADEEYYEAHSPAERQELTLKGAAHVLVQITYLTPTLRASHTEGWSPTPFTVSPPIMVSPVPRKPLQSGNSRRGSISSIASYDSYDSEDDELTAEEELQRTVFATHNLLRRATLPIQTIALGALIAGRLTRTFWIRWEEELWGMRRERELVLLACIMIAQKFLHDAIYTLPTWSNIVSLSTLPPRSLATTERLILRDIKWDINTIASYENVEKVVATMEGVKFPRGVWLNERSCKEAERVVEGLFGF